MGSEKTYFEAWKRREFWHVKVLDFGSQTTISDILF